MSLAALEIAIADKRAELIHTLSILLQTKVYLFWRGDEPKSREACINPSIQTATLQTSRSQKLHFMPHRI
jgi:hypothetical protein